MKKILTNLGLEEKEIIVFLGCLKHTKNTPTSLSHLCQIKRSTVYTILKKLLKKGLIRQETKGNRRVFCAESIEICKQQLIAKKEKELIKTQKYAKEFEQEAQAIYQTKTNDFRISHKTESLKFAMKKLLQKKEDIFWIGDLSELFEFISPEYFFENFTLNRFQHNTKTFAITDQSILENKKFSEMIGKFRNFKFVPQKIPGLLAITKTKAYFFAKENSTPKLITIYEKKLIQTLNYLFKIIWK